jgi:GR25 family glycosyltransferase involved in LPS biosynthesis
MEKYIDKIFYINLDKRLDRKAEIEGELSRMGLSGERFPAIQNDKGFIGCSLSHLELIKIAKQRGYKNVLILEDDFQFTLTKEKFEENMNTFFESNLSYDVVMLAYNYKGKLESNNAIVSKINSVNTTAGYLVHNKVYDELINNYQVGVKKLIETKKCSHWAIDIYWKHLLKNKEWYVFNERMGKQRKSYSDIEKKVVNYGV